MEKRKPWQFTLILTVIILTLVNILPTIIYYSKPLAEPIGQEGANEIAADIVTRVNDLEQDSLDWLDMFCGHLGVKTQSVELAENNPGLVLVTFKDQKDADHFRFFLQKAGPLIPFAPSQLSVSPQQAVDPLRQVYVQRRIAVHLPEEELTELFTFSPKEIDEEPAAFYRTLVEDRATEVAVTLGGEGLSSRLTRYITATNNPVETLEAILTVSRDITQLEKTFGSETPLARRLFAAYTQSDDENGSILVQQLISKMETASQTLTQRRERLIDQQKAIREQQGFLDSEQAAAIDALEEQAELVTQAATLLRQNANLFAKGAKPLTEAEVAQLLRSSKVEEGIQSISLSGRNPFVESIAIDWNNDQILLNPYQDITVTEERSDSSELGAFQWEQLEQRLIDEIARVSRLTDEGINPKGESFVVELNSLTNSSGVLALNLGEVAKAQATQLASYLRGSWHPKHTDLSRDLFPIWNQETFAKLSSSDSKLGLVVYAPAASAEAPPEGFQRGSLYVIARGLNRIVDKYQGQSDSLEAEAFLEDFSRLQDLLRNGGFISYPGSSFQINSAYSRDYIFELPDFALNLLNATREDFSVHGSRRWAVLELTNVEQRIHAANKIDDSIHEDLLKWKDEYDRVQVALDSTEKLTVPPVTENPYLANLKLTTKKYFRGDDRKILKWGLDLSGGKTVRIGLLDQNNRPVNDPNDLRQAVNELFTRINKMGVSEQTIRIENNHILVEFPGSQALSASELIQGSTMTFHIVNEKFGRANPLLAQASQQFLQEVWNKAVVTNRKDAESLNEIAWENLGGEPDGSSITPQTPHAKMLYEAGLRFAPPNQQELNNRFDESTSRVTIWRGDDPAEWQNAAHPLIIVFRNFALEGSSLEGVRAAYDPTKGNILQFGVSSSYASAEKSGNPRDDFYAWTSRFAEERIGGTANEAYSGGRGWRMAVVLNGQVISAPNLVSPLSDGGIISGSFSQRDVNKLAADLKAGSLSFTPKILSETNISADLGTTERSRGLYASVIGLILVVCAMTGYYHFAGIVASAAVLMNLLIMWGVLQNLDAALTLPGLAGIILTVGMAVDANVLVFERIREEFGISGRIASAIQSGYRKAFSAIIDSNITTIIAALILLQFDAGPIKGFAVTLIIGIASSMFTALFMTRYFFAGWVQNPKNKELKMRDWVGRTNFDFLSKSKAVMALSAVVISIGLFTLSQNQETILGLEFTGGYSLNVELQEKEDGFNYRQATIEAMEKLGAVSTDFQVKKLNRPNQLNIQFGSGMEQEGRPWDGMADELPDGDFVYGYLKHPKLDWVVNALEHDGLDLPESQREVLDQNWSVMSGQFSDAMRNNALIALGCAMLAILIYITVRFEFKYAIAAIVALTHDVTISLGVLALLHSFGVPLQITMEIVGALMTIIGYSLNATIVIFDRIREDSRVMRKSSTREVVRHALNQTLGRTLMTSGTTALVLLSLVILGGQAIFAFSFIMLLGVLFGTLSSLFLACPVMLFFHDRESKKAGEELSLSRA